MTNPPSHEPHPPELMPLGSRPLGAAADEPPPSVGATAPVAAIHSAAAPAVNGGEAAPRYEFIWKVHDYTNEYIRFADSKATLILGVVGALLAAELAKAGARMALVHPASWDFPSWIAFVSMGLLTLSAIAAVGAIAPRMRSHREKGVIYWGAIREHVGLADFHDHLESLTPGELESEVVSHVFELSGIARDKFHWVNIAAWLGIVGGVLGVMVIALY